EVPNGGARADRTSLQGAVTAHEPTHRLGNEIERRPVRIGPAFPEPGDAGMNDPWSQCRQLRLTQAQVSHHTGAEVVDDDVRCGDESVQRLFPGGTAEVEDNRAFVAIEGGEIPAQPLDDSALPA